MAKLKKILRKVCSYNPVFGTKLRKKLGLTGKQIKSKLLGRGSITSAGSYAYNRGEYYGPTGSIVGRY